MKVYISWNIRRTFSTGMSVFAGQWQELFGVKTGVRWPTRKKHSDLWYPWQLAYHRNYSDLGPCQLTYHRNDSDRGPCQLIYHRSHSDQGPLQLTYHRNHSDQGWGVGAHVSLLTTGIIKTGGLCQLTKHRNHLDWGLCCNHCLDWRSMPADLPQELFRLGVHGSWIATGII